MTGVKQIGLAVVVSAALSALGPTNAGANTVYSYTGNNYTFTSDGTPPSGAYDATMSVSGSFTLALPLAANLPYASIKLSILSFSFFDGRNTITNLNQDASVTSFNVTTDAAGMIDLWQIELATPHAAIDGSMTYTIYSTNLVGGVEDDAFTGQCVTSISPDCGSLASDSAHVFTAGTWGITTVASATPLPAAFPLFATGVGVMSLLARRRKRKNVGARSAA